MKQEIKEGDWVVCGAIMLNRICSSARLVTKVSGQRVYLDAPPHKFCEGNYVMKKTIVAVMPSREAAEEVVELDREFQKRILELQDLHKTSVNALIDKHQTKG